MPETFEPPANPYIIDVTRGPELGRLLHQSQLFTTAMGGLFPAALDLSDVERILDIGCGPGEWALAVAHAFPDREVVGMDLDEGMVSYARTSAWAQGLDNSQFEVMDARHPLHYTEGAFDLIQGRFLAGFLDRASWPALLSECFRVLAPGGRLLLREAEMGVSSSPALQQLGHYLAQAFYEQKRTFAPDRYSLGITHMLGKLLKEAGFVQLQQQPFVLDASADSDLFYGMFKNLEVLFSLLKPYLLASGVVEEEVFEEQYRQMIREMVAEDFASLSYGLQIWGLKPEENAIASPSSIR